MFGIYGYLPGNVKSESSVKETLEESGKHFCVKYNGKQVELNTINKFEYDKCCINTGKYVVVIDGVLLNLKSLFCKYKEETIENLIVCMYKKNGERFFAEFRGNFAGYFEDIDKNVAMAFTNQVGEKTLFYHVDSSGEIVFGSKVNGVKNYMQQCGMKCELNLAAAYAILTYAYMYDDMTMYSEIKRIVPGHYLLITEGKAELKKYYELKQQSNCKMSKEEAIKEVDRLFDEAVRMQVQKNAEYGYDNYIPLSAGLDCRMTAYAAKKFSSEPMVNFTYSETEQLDNIIPMRMAKDLKNHWVFKSLDNGLALLDIEQSTKVGDGLIYYGWPSQLRDFMKLINTDKMGIVHTGVLGDVIVGTFFKEDNRYVPYQIGDGAYSRKLIYKFKEYCNEKEYINYEVGMFLNRGFNGACLGYALPFGEYAEALSPFMNIDFMDFCMSLPLEWRCQHRLYYQWVKDYYPSAAKYSHNGIRIPTHEFPEIRVRGKKFSIERIPSLAGNILKTKMNSRFNMNPMDYWYTTNDILKKRMDQYFAENVQCLGRYSQLKNDAQKLYVRGTALEKVQVISLLAMIQVFEVE